MQSILVIDDQAELRVALELTLTRAGYAVTVVDQWSEALKVLQEKKPDLVITDVIMPGKDGIEITLELRKTLPELPVIVMTGGGHLEPSYYLKMARSLGAKGILQKPFSSEQLLMTVSLALPAPKA